MNEKPVKLSHYITQYKKDIALTVLCVLITVWINLALPYLIRLTIDDLTAGQMTAGRLTHLLLLYGGLALFAIYFSRHLRSLPLKLSHKVEYAIRRDLFAHMTQLDQEFFRTERTGDLMTKMSSDMTIVCNSVGQGFLQVLRTGGVLIFASIVMFLTDAALALIVVTLYIPSTLLLFLLIRVMRRRQERLQAHVSELSNFSQESFAGIRCIKGFALEQRRIGLFEKLNQKLIGLHTGVQATRQSLWPLMAFCFSLCIILVLNLGGRQVITGERSLGTLVQFIQYLLYMQWPLMALSWIASLLQRGKVSWQRICDLFAREPQIADSDRTDRSLTKLDGEIVLQNVSLDFDGRRYLDRIDLQIPRGVSLGITGPTGSGKTLLVSLIARLVDPTEGVLRIDGHDVTTIPLSTLRSAIGFAAQEPILFSHTLRHNIGYGIETLDDEQIQWAANIAHLTGDIDGFPERYETLLGERGVTLSGGQRQRTSISRAIARHPEILILDDVLASVDTQTEAAIMGKLRPVMSQRTALMVSHRISTLRYTDEIIVIEEGRITQRGTHNELLTQPGYYAELNILQQLEQELGADA